MNVKFKAALSTLGVVGGSALVGSLMYFIFKFVPVEYMVTGMVSGVAGYLIYLVYDYFVWKYNRYQD
mgnify:CR=1 FL=1